MTTRISADAFTAQALAALRAALPAVTFTRGDERLTITAAIPAPDGGSHGAQINLHNFYRTYTTGGGLNAIIRSIAAAAAAAVGSLTAPHPTRAQALAGLMVTIGEPPASLDDQAGRAIFPEGKTSEEIAAMLADSAYGRAWRYGLWIFPVLDSGENMYHATIRALRDWGLTFDEALEAGLARTRAALARTTPDHDQVYEGVRLRIWDNDLPGYTVSRLAFPDLFGPPPTGGERSLIVAPDRDLVARVDFPADQIGQALLLLGIVAADRVNKPRQVLGGEHLIYGKDGTIRLAGTGSIAVPVGPRPGERRPR